MTNEEKLESFYEKSIDSANKQAQEKIKEHQAALDQMFEEHKQRKNRLEKIELADEEEKLKRENNIELSREQLGIRRNLSVRSDALKKELFEEVVQNLMEFKKTPAYIDYICQKVKEAQKMVADGEEVHYLLDSTDQGLAETISRKTGVPMETSKENMMGGVRAKIPGRNLLFDFAFSVLLQEEKDRFTFEGGYEHV